MFTKILTNRIFLVINSITLILLSLFLFFRYFYSLFFMEETVHTPFQAIVVVGTSFLLFAISIKVMPYIINAKSKGSLGFRFPDRVLLLIGLIILAFGIIGLWSLLSGQIKAQTAGPVCIPCGDIERSFTISKIPEEIWNEILVTVLVIYSGLAIILYAIGAKLYLKKLGLFVE
jgi:hypothetical protein